MKKGQLDVLGNRTGYWERELIFLGKPINDDERIGIEKGYYKNDVQVGFWECRYSNNKVAYIKYFVE